jgi:DegV family protein with EDD domain
MPVLPAERRNPMYKTAIIVDSNCDLPEELLVRYDIKVIPIRVMLNGVDYGMTRDYEGYYRELEVSKKLPVTSAVTPFEYLQYFEQYSREGYEDAVYISMSSTGSSTFGNSFIAKNWFEENHDGKGNMKIHLLDSLNYSLAYGYSAVKAAVVREAGGTAEEIIAAAKEWIDSLEVCVTAFTLDHIRRSGRIGNGLAVIGHALNIRPVVKVVGGLSSPAAVVRGNNAAVAGVAEYFRKNMLPGTDYVVLRGISPDPAEELIKMMIEICGKAPSVYTYVGPTTAANTGPKMTGIGFMSTRIMK